MTPSPTTLPTAGVDSVSVPGVTSVPTDALGWLIDRWSDLLSAVGNATGIEMLQYGFMHRAFLVGILIAVMAPLIGTFLVHRQLALIGDALAHTAFAGVAVGLFVNAVLDVGVSPYLTAVVVAMIAALAIELISEVTDAYNDVSMAIVLSTGFALGAVLISLNAGGLAVGINQYLFGNLATVSRSNAMILIGLFLVVTLVVGVTYKQLLYVTFDETAARVAGLNVPWYNRVMTMLTAMVVVGAMQIMGVILVAAMLVVPVAGAAQLARSFREALLASIILAELAVLVGITLSFQYEATAGGTIVLVAVALYVGAVLLGKVQSSRETVGDIHASAEERTAD
ncbi:metal ABC transporter permease [Natronorubrum sulfidifaciens]|uniref:ABC-type transport system permease protein n=1 Tax=Natronorubrum sulfidifaciens JCM 14089 TaxID=1230460 RepID=L9WDC9_9EURY|nr:metal ABC transporter permease [Natronorubrum sulfidifaciens]ELY47362.1 ABC-type transport system permease protein [Natronorubrum sulfidifaciens JCM 14089]